MYVEDLDLHPSKVGETVRQVIDRAFDEAYRRRHGYVGTEHLFLSLAQKEWDTFAAIMRDVGVSPHAILQAVEEQVRQLPHGDTRDVSVEPAAKLVMKLAVHYASRAGRRTIGLRICWLRYSKTSMAPTRRYSGGTAWSRVP